MTAGTERTFRSALIRPVAVGFAAYALVALAPDVVAESWGSGEPSMFERAGLAGVLLAVLWAIFRFAQAGLRFDTEGLVICQGWKTVRLQYEAVEAFSLGRSMVVATLRDGSQIPVPALPFRGVVLSRKPAAERLIKELNWLLDQRKQTAAAAKAV